MAENTGAFAKLLNVLRSQRNYVPSTLTFPQLDVPAEAAALRLVERAEQNARENRPVTEAAELGDVESEMAARVQGVYAQSLDIYHQGLETYDRRINSNSPLETLSIEIKGTGRDAVAEYRLLAHKAQEDINFDRKNLEEVEDHFVKFKELHKLMRGPRYPVGHRIHVGVILLVLLLDTIANGYLLGVRDEFGLLGGVLQALLVAFLNVALGIIAGRVAIPNLIHRFFSRKLGGLLVLLVVIGLACALNLSFAHYRDLFSIGVPTPGEQALADIQNAPFTLRDIKSWWLAAIGMLFAFIALVDGYKWDDRYPEYGDLSRQRDDQRREYLDRKHAWLERIANKREEARREVGELRHGIEMMYADILQAATGRQGFIASFIAHREHLEAAGNQLMRIYRDANRTTRSTPAPRYFDTHWSLKAEPLATPTALDRDHLAERVQRIYDALSEAMDRIHEVHDETVDSFIRMDLPGQTGSEDTPRIRLVG